MGEHPQHLYQHAAHRGGGVERFCRGTEYDSGPVEFVEQGDQIAQAAGEPVDSVDEQDIDGPARAAARARPSPSRSVVAPEASSVKDMLWRQPGWESM
nr:hypothetical protein [Nocardia panacis]